MHSIIVVWGREALPVNSLYIVWLDHGLESILTTLGFCAKKNKIKEKGKLFGWARILEEKGAILLLDTSSLLGIGRRS